jgi:hypothetical protein
MSEDQDKKRVETMTNFVNVLLQIQQEQKTIAVEGGSWPRTKIIKECCEVLIEFVSNDRAGRPRKQESEELDLLWCLVDKYYGNFMPLVKFEQKLQSRGFTPTPAQEHLIQAWKAYLRKQQSKSDI